jgi:hypothetical protein
VRSVTHAPLYAIVTPSGNYYTVPALLGFLDPYRKDLLFAKVSAR